MNKLIKSSIILSCVLLLSACGSGKKKEQLYILNWGDYINYDLVEEFESANNVKVNMTEVESNELMYEQIKSNRTPFDLAFPSDYMIEQLDEAKLLKDIDYSLLKNYKEDMFNPLVKEYGPKTTRYVPYFNGTIGLMYNTNNIKGIKETIEKEGFNVLFDNSLLPKARIGMYNSSRDAYASALFNLGYSINTTNQSELDQASALLKKVKYEIYGDDNLKKNVVTGNLDVALVYSGDFFEEYGIALDEGNDSSFGYYAPSETNYWLDGMVIPTTSKNSELAHKFIDFMIDHDTSLENTKYIGFASPITSVLDDLSKDEDYSYMSKHPNFDPAKIKNFKPEAYRYLGFDYTTKLEEAFAATKVK